MHTVQSVVSPSMEWSASATLNELRTIGTYEFSQHPQWDNLPISYLLVVVVSSTLHVSGKKLRAIGLQNQANVPLCTSV